MKQPELSRTKGLPTLMQQPVVQPPTNLVLAAFTPRELDAVRSILRDSDSEQAVRMLNAALARAGK